MINKEFITFVRQENRQYENTRDKLMKHIRNKLTKVTYEEIPNGGIITIPLYNNYNDKTTNKIINQLNPYVSKNENNFWIFENKLEFLKSHYKNLKLIDGKQIMKESLLKILDYIFMLNNSKMILENIYIFVNNYSKANIYLIKNLINKFKLVNIITENLKYFRILEQEMYEEGVLITVSSNKKKSARNAKYIVNMDYSKEDFEKYNINMQAIIINLTSEVEFFKGLFNGVLVNNFELNIDENYSQYINEFYGDIDTKLYLERELYSGKYYLGKVDDICLKYDVHIRNLIGVRGVLQECEFSKNSCCY